MLGSRNYILFSGSEFYPEGGAKDLRGTFDSSDDAINFFNEDKEDYNKDWAHIFSIKDCKIVYEIEWIRFGDMFEYKWILFKCDDE